MTKQELIRAAAKAAGVTKETAGAVINAALDAATEAIAQGDPVKIHSIGKFERRQRAARSAHDFRTGDLITTSATCTIYFKPSVDLRRRVSDPVKEES